MNSPGAFQIFPPYANRTKEMTYSVVLRTINCFKVTRVCWSLLETPMPGHVIRYASRRQSVLILKHRHRNTFNSWTAYEAAPLRS